MAVRLASFPESQCRRYSWETWSREPGTIWQLRRGEDYTIGTADMARRAYTYADNHGLRARTSQVGGETLVLQFLKPAEEEEEEEEEEEAP